MSGAQGKINMLPFRLLIVSTSCSDFLWWRSFEIVTLDEFLDNLTGLANSPANYDTNFRRTELVFRHQSVLNAVENCLAPLHPWTDAPSNDYIKTCGHYPLNLFN